MSQSKLNDFETQARKQLDVEESGYLRVGDLEIPYFKGKDEDGSNVVLAMREGTTLGFSYMDKEKGFVGDWKVMASSSFAHVLEARHVSSN